MNISNAILRVFEVRAKRGKAEVLRQKLSSTSVSVVAGQPGNLGYFFGEKVPSASSDLVFISVWRDLDSIRSCFGEEWEESFLPAGYEELIEHCSIHHLEVDGKLER